MAEIDFGEFDTVDLASEMMVPTETRTQKDPEPPAPEPAATSTQEPEPEGTVKVTEVIDPDDAAGYLADGIDAMMTIAGGAFYAIKMANILTKEQKAVWKAARKKPESAQSDEEKALIAFHAAEKARLEEKSDAVEMSEKELAKLRKSAKGMIKVKNWKVGPDMAFWVTAVDILSDRVIDAFMD